MKVKNLVIGLRVQVKETGYKGFFSASAGKFGVIKQIDVPHSLDVQIEYEDGAFEWGNHKGIKHAPVEHSTQPSVGVGSRVRLLEDRVLGFLAGDVGTVIAFDRDGDVVVYFDVARNGWESREYSIPDLHGLYVPPKYLEVITG